MIYFIKNINYRLKLIPIVIMSPIKCREYKVYDHVSSSELRTVPECKDS
jgi:hypothetical protein